MIILKQLVVFFCFCFFLSNSVFAETDNGDGSFTTDPGTTDYADGFITGNCAAGESSAMVISNTHVSFGTCYNTFAISTAINEVLTNEGISVDKIHYKWLYMNGCFNTSTSDGVQKDWCNQNLENRVNLQTGEILDSEWAEQFDILTVEVEITDSSGNIIETRTYSYDTWYDWMNPNSYSDSEEASDIDGDGVVEYWQVEEDFIQLYDHTHGVGSIYTPESLGSATFRVSSKDGGMWDGNYGPNIRSGGIWFTYRANPCAQTAMYDPSCSGYAEAVATYEYDNNCSANAAYDPGCPGYADAVYYNDQCTADATYDAGCPGYADAYYDQQCSANSQYDSGCSGYENEKSTEPGMNVSGQGSDYIFIYRGNNPDVFDILVADLGNITNWVWDCEKRHGASDGDECPGTLHGKIKDATLNGDYLFLYTTDIDDNIVWPDSGRWYSFAEFDYWTEQCSTDATWHDSCSVYTSQQYDESCSVDPTYDAKCRGYASAHHDQQCSANAMYDSSCPGYSSAYESYQCEQNSLYSSSCSGYEEAYYNYQCSANSLYDSACPGYDTAYYNQQCSSNALYDSGCAGYDTAYYNQQCSSNALYDSGCPGYETAYYNQQCSADALYDSACPGYATAYYNQQCTISPLYDSGCIGYDSAYLGQQCTISTLYSTECPGYETAYMDYQCGLDATYDSSCTGYADAYLLQQCNLNTLYDMRCTGYADAYFDQQCLQNPQYDTQCNGYVAEVTESPTSTPIVEGTGTGDAVIDSIIAAPIIIVMPIEIVQPAPVEVEPIVAAPVPIIPTIQLEIATGAPAETTEQLEIAIEQEIAAELNIEVDVEVTEPEAVVETIEEEIVDEPIVEEVVEEVVEEEIVEEVVEEVVEEEIVEEVVEEVVEEEIVEEVVEEEIVEEVVEEEVIEPVVKKKVVKKKVVKKMTKAEKQKAKVKKMKEIIKKKLEKLAIVMGEAQSLSDQKALQAQISALINFVPGFSAYGQRAIPGVDFYTSTGIYKDKKVPENQRGLLNGLASQILHEKMVDQQYEKIEDE